jgi:hypothetical protein
MNAHRSAEMGCPSVFWSFACRLEEFDVNPEYEVPRRRPAPDILAVERSFAETVKGDRGCGWWS